MGKLLQGTQSGACYTVLKETNGSTTREITRKMKTRLRNKLVMAAFSALLLSGCASHHRTEVITEREITSDPPPPREEVAPPSPGDEFVWVSGYWEHHHKHWTWVSGHWQPRPHVGATWQSGHWDHTTDGWVWTPGRWD